MLDFIGFLSDFLIGSIPLISTNSVTIAYAVVTFLLYDYSRIYAFFIAKQESFMKYKTTQYKLCNRTQNNSPHIKISHFNRIFSIVSMYTVSRHQISPFFLCSFSMFRFGLIQFFYVPLLKIDLFADIIKKIFSLYSFSMNTKTIPISIT